MNLPTKRQIEVLCYIKDYIRQNRLSPTIREISEHFEIAIKGAHDHVKALQKKGMITMTHNRTRSINIIDSETSPDNEKVKVPILGNVAAGIPILAEKNHENDIILPKSMTGSEKLFAMIVKGDSMKDAGIKSGDIAVFRQQETAENGEIVIAILDENVTLKRFFKEKNRIRLQAENSEYAPIFTSEVQILGRLVTAIKKF